MKLGQDVCGCTIHFQAATPFLHIVTFDISQSHLLNATCCKKEVPSNRPKPSFYETAKAAIN